MTLGLCAIKTENTSKRSKGSSSPEDDRRTKRETFDLPAAQPAEA